MMKINKLIVFILWIFISSLLFCQQTEVIFLQLNDVYEIAPLEGGKVGGLARVATIRKDLMKQYTVVYTILSGDFISPSALGTSEYEGKRINGRQMVDVLNHIGLDYVTFGNHEFDYKYEVLQDRMDESKFEWISSNVSHDQNGLTQSFGRIDHSLPRYVILKIPANEKLIKLCLLGLCIDANKQPYVAYDNYIESAKKYYNELKDSIDYFIGITHLSIDQDKKLAGEVPALRLIMGGHEHENMFYTIGETIIAKADANAKTVYFHKLIFNEKNKLVDIKSELKKVDETVVEDPVVKSAVDEWVSRAFKGFTDKGFDPNIKVIDFTEPLDGREQVVRNELCALGYLIATSMLQASPGSDCAVFNSGAIRIDDVLYGEITQYDIIRILPFGGKILQVEMKGELLKKIMDTGWNNKGNGGFLQFAGIEYTAGGWKTKGELISDNKVYNIAINDFLLSGMEQNMGFLTKDNPGIIKITEPDPNNKSDIKNDFRFAVIDYLKKWNK
ncbi:MAG TPA: bifunctional metallophosphatase/5'-nucleotidase [Ignavibacteria bacterium]|nr:bifunctional metallophosphatase/5'-nucleotidase [Ignavibacteria bacterium]